MHDHSHHSSHQHIAAPKTGRQGHIFLIATLLNILFIAVELLFGFWADSLALIADAGHNASDVIGLLLAWGAFALSRKKPSGRFTYGLQSVSIMAAIANALLLLIAVAAIGWAAVERFNAPISPDAGTVIIVALIGTIINGATAYILHKGHKHDLNMRGAYLHMLADAGISVGVVISGIIIMATGWLWVDPFISLLIALMIVVGTWRLLSDSVKLALHAVPSHIQMDEVRSYLESQPGVTSVHDLHIWATGTTNIALSAHLLMPEGHPGDHFIHHISHELEERFHIDHTTLQIETSNTADDCHLSDH